MSNVDGVLRGTTSCSCQDVGVHVMLPLAILSVRQPARIDMGDGWLPARSEEFSLFKDEGIGLR